MIYFGLQILLEKHENENEDWQTANLARAIKVAPKDMYFGYVFSC
jgi:hypothetical protein